MIPSRVSNLYELSFRLVIDTQVNFALATQSSEGKVEIANIPMLLSHSQNIMPDAVSVRLVPLFIHGLIGLIDFDLIGKHVHVKPVIPSHCY
jgi:hypothetical protein